MDARARTISANKKFLEKNGLDPKVYTGFCLGEGRYNHETERTDFYDANGEYIESHGRQS